MVVICGYIREPPGILTNSNGIWVCCVTSVVSNSVAPQTVAHQVPLSMGFPRHELPSPPPGDLPDLEIKPKPVASSALVGRFFTTNTTWEAQQYLGGI